MPAKPTGLTTSATYNSVTLTWDDPGDDSITHYQILRRIPGFHKTGEFDTIEPNTGSADTTYIDYSVSPQQEYIYRVKAVNGHGASQWSRYSSIFTAVAPDPADLAPMNLTAALAEGGVALAWDAPTEDAKSVTGYEVLRAKGDADLATLEADTGSAATAYTDATAAEGGKSYTYRVIALRGGEKSRQSNPATVVMPPASPTGLTATAAYDAVTLTWHDPGDGAITHYQVSRQLPGEQPAGEFAVIESDTGSADTVYTDDDVSPETRYLYRVKAVSAHGAGQWSEQFAVTTPAPGPEALAPSGLTARLQTGDDGLLSGVELSWEAPKGHPDLVTGYAIHRSQGEADLTILVANTGSAATEYSDTTAVELSETYAYQVVALRGEEKTWPSGQASLQTPGIPAQPTGLKVSARNVPRIAVDLTWRNPQDEHITHYKLLRREPGNHAEGTFDTIKTFGSSRSTWVRDEEAEPRTFYVYRVVAVSLYGESPRSSFAEINTPARATHRMATDVTAKVVMPDADDTLGVKVSWSAPRSNAMSVTGYEIHRAVGDGDFVTLVANTGSTATKYIDDTATERGRTYAYRIVALRGGEESDRSDEATVTVPYHPALLAPTDLVAKAKTLFSTAPTDAAVSPAPAVVLSWQAPAVDAESVTGYEILRAWGGGPLKTLVADTGSAATEYTDTTADEWGRTYRYQVRARRGGEKSRSSNEAAVFIPLTQIVVVGPDETPPVADLAVGSSEFDLLVSHDRPRGIWGDGSDIYVLNSATNDVVLRYPRFDDALPTAWIHLNIPNVVPFGIWAYANTMYVAANDRKVYAYRLKDNDSDLNTFVGDRLNNREFSLANANGDPRGMWGNAETIWVVNDEGGNSSNDKIYAYRRSDGARDSSKDFDNLMAAGNTSPTGIWTDGSSMFVADRGDDKIYAYNMSDRLRNERREFSLQSGNGNPQGIWGRDGKLWVVNDGTDDPDDDSKDKVFVYNAPPKPSLNGGLVNSAPTGISGNAGTIWVVNDAVGSGAGDKLYAYKRSDGTIDPDKDFDTLNAAGNNDPIGAWNDSRTMYVLDRADLKIYAYKTSDKSRDAGKDISLSADNSAPTDIWGLFFPASIWVADNGGGPDSKIFGYNHVTRSYDPNKDFNTLNDAGNEDPRGIAAHGTRMFVVDDDDQMVYVYSMSDKARVTSQDFALHADNADAGGAWVGDRLYVVDRADGRLYSYTVPFPPTGKPTVSGTLEEGRTLTANTSGIEDENGIPAGVVFSYQWIRGDVEIVGANDRTYQLRMADTGHRIRIRVSFTDSDGFRESITSNPTSSVGVDWTAVLTIGCSDGYCGANSAAGQPGSISDNTFVFSGVEYAVLHIRQGDETSDAPGALELELQQDLQNRIFMLQVGDRRFHSFVATKSKPGGANVLYTWPNADLELSDGDTVDAFLKVLDQTLDICARTEYVRDTIMAHRAITTDKCSEVDREELAEITELTIFTDQLYFGPAESETRMLGTTTDSDGLMQPSFERRPADELYELKAGDLAGLIGLQVLRIEYDPGAREPAEIWRQVGVWEHEGETYKVFYRSGLQRIREISPSFFEPVAGTLVRLSLKGQQLYNDSSNSLSDERGVSTGGVQPAGEPGGAGPARQRLPRLAQRGVQPAEEPANAAPGRGEPPEPLPAPLRDVRRPYRVAESLPGR